MAIEVIEWIGRHIDALYLAFLVCVGLAALAEVLKTAGRTLGLVRRFRLARQRQRYIDAYDARARPPYSK